MNITNLLTSDSNVMYYDGGTTTITSDDFTLNWYPGTGVSWGYYVNSGDYKIEYEGNKIIVNVLVAGLDKDDIEAYLENEVLYVKSSKPGWNGNLNLNIYLNGYNLDFKNIVVKFMKGVLRVEFNKKDEKIKLKIE